MLKSTNLCKYFKGRPISEGNPGIIFILIINENKESRAI